MRAYRLRSETDFRNAVWVQSELPVHRRLSLCEGDDDEDASGARAELGLRRVDRIGDEMAGGGQGGGGADLRRRAGLSAGPRGAGAGRGRIEGDLLPRRPEAGGRS